MTAPRPTAGRAEALWTLALVAVTLAALVLAGSAGTPAASSGPEARRSAAGPRQLVCFGQPAPADVSLAAAGPAGRVHTGADTVALKRHRVLRTTVRARPLVISADGELADALTGSSLTEDGVTTACPEARPSWWFLGAGASPGHRSTLVLVNPRAGVATVDVTVLGGDGRVQAPDLRGVAVPKGRPVELQLPQVSPAAGQLAVHVEASRGLVAAGVLDRVGPGQQWLPAQTAPRERAVVPGVPRRPGGLLLSNPRGSEVVARVEVSGKDGSFQSTGVAEQRVPAYSTVELPLGTAVTRDQSGVLVRGGGPLLVDAVASRGRVLVHAAAVTPLVGPTAAGLPPGTRSTVTLTATQRAGRVRLSYLDGSGVELDRRRLSVPSTATLSTPVPSRTATVVARGEGDVAVALVLRRGWGSAVLPMQSVSSDTAPVVRPGRGSVSVSPGG